MNSISTMKPAFVLCFSFYRHNCNGKQKLSAWKQLLFCRKRVLKGLLRNLKSFKTQEGTKSRQKKLKSDCKWVPKVGSSSSSLKKEKESVCCAKNKHRQSLPDAGTQWVMVAINKSAYGSGKVVLKMNQNGQLQVITPSRQLHVTHLVK